MRGRVDKISKIVSCLVSEIVRSSHYTARPQRRLRGAVRISSERGNLSPLTRSLSTTPTIRTTLGATGKRNHAALPDVLADVGSDMLNGSTSDPGKVAPPSGANGDYASLGNAQPALHQQQAAT